MLKVLSLGAGVQSSAVLLMSCVGELPKLDAAIFADTGWEPAAVYRHLLWLEDEAKKAGIPVYRVSAGNIREDGLHATLRGVKTRGERYSTMPYYTGNPDGSVGTVKRQCTREYKVRPIGQFIRRTLLGLAPKRPAPRDSVEQWFGISADEARRIRISTERWKTHRYPLVYDLPRAYRREDCLRWLESHGYPIPARSACIGCPFHTNEEWRALRERPEEWADAVEFDEAIRHRGGMRGELFLHRSGQPLVQVDLSTPEERGQLSWGAECLGMCGV